MTARNVSEHLYLALAVILIGGISLGWIGGKAVDYAFEDVRKNSDFRVAATTSNQNLEKRVENLEQAIKIMTKNSETLARIDERLKQWEPVTR